MDKKYLLIKGLLQLPHTKVPIRIVRAVIKKADNIEFAEGELDKYRSEQHAVTLSYVLEVSGPEFEVLQKYL